MVENLRRSGLKPVGRGGFRGRYRSFQTGYPDVYYASGFYRGRATVALGCYGTDKEYISEALARHRDHIAGKLGDGTEWHEGKGSRWVWLKAEEAIDDPSSIPDEVGQWITENLLRLRDVLQPYLDGAMADIGTPNEDVTENE